MTDEKSPNLVRLERLINKQLDEASERLRAAIQRLPVEKRADVMRVVLEMLGLSESEIAELVKKAKA